MTFATISKLPVSLTEKFKCIYITVHIPPIAIPVLTASRILITGTYSLMALTPCTTLTAGLLFRNKTYEKS